MRKLELRTQCAHANLFPEITNIPKITDAAIADAGPRYRARSPFIAFTVITENFYSFLFFF